MFRKMVPPEVLQTTERALEIASMELLWWSGRWAYWPEDDPSYAREIAEYPTISLCQRVLAQLQHAPDRRAVVAAAEALMHARHALATIDGEAYCAGAIDDQTRWIDTEPTVRLLDDALFVLRTEGIHVLPTSSPPTGGPPER
jgi:hypothetical protein